MAARASYKKTSPVYYPYGNTKGRKSAVHVARKASRKRTRKSTQVAK